MKERQLQIETLKQQKHFAEAFGLIREWFAVGTIEASEYVKLIQSL